MSSTTDEGLKELEDKPAPKRKAPVKKVNQAARRFRCKVESTRSGIQHFELIVPDPYNTARPIPVRGKCGVIIEEGLTKYIIDRLQQSYRMETQEKFVAEGSMGGLTTESVKVPNYRVEVYEEIQNPKPLGGKKR